MIGIGVVHLGDVEAAPALDDGLRIDEEHGVSRVARQRVGAAAAAEPIGAGIAGRHSDRNVLIGAESLSRKFFKDYRVFVA